MADDDRGHAFDASPDDGRVPTGPRTSDSLRYAREAPSFDARKIDFVEQGHQGGCPSNYVSLESLDRKGG